MKQKEVKPLALDKHQALLLIEAYNQVSGMHDIMSALIHSEPDKWKVNVLSQLVNKADICKQKMERLGATDMEVSL